MSDHESSDAAASSASLSSPGSRSPRSSGSSPSDEVSSSSVSPPTLPPKRRSAALRQRDRQQRRQAAKAAARQRKTPASKSSSATSLWRAREKQFEAFRASIIVLPVPASVARVDKAKGYSLHVMSVLNWVLPSSILGSWSLSPPSQSANGAENESGEDSDADEELLVTLGVHVSLFHSASKRFFGNTWVSPELAVDAFQIKQDRHSTDNTLRHVVENVVLNFRAYFVTDVVDASCVGVVELVAYEKDPDSKATVNVVGCGWTMLPLFALSLQRQQPGGSKASAVPSSAFGIDASAESANVFAGSPRVLWELAPTMWHTQEKQDRCKLYYQLVLYEPLLAVAMCVRKNELVGALEPIPGLKNGNLANIDVGRNPKALLREDEDTTFEDALATFAKLASLVPKTILLEETFPLTVSATRVAIHLREEVEANLVARLQISRRAIHAGAARIDGEVSARVLKLALHNGRCFRTRQHTIPLKVEQQGSDHLRCVANQTQLKGFVLHPQFAIVVVLQFTVHFRIAWPPKLKQQAIDAKKPLPPEEDVVLVTMGARTLVPSDGKKLYLYDKHHHATADASAPLMMMADDPNTVSQQHGGGETQRRMLHVELLSGAPCRAYSDNPLYTPPNLGGKRLLEKKHGLSLTDSIAFVDLRLSIDGDGAKTTPTPPAPSSPKRAPPSPAKSLRDNNDDSDSGGERVHAAAHWAAKMLGKADKNAILAQTLNALATSKAPTQDNQTHMSPPRSPVKQRRESAAEVDPLPITQSQAKTSELSRASRTLLARYGFTDAHDTSATSHEVASSPSKRQPRTLPLASSKSLDVELNDVYKAHEVRFHFAAFRSCRAAPLVPARVYFTFQFYSFPPTRTETLRLSKGFDNGADGESHTFLLMRESPATKPALAIQFDVDTTATRDPLEPRSFAAYLLQRNLYVDVWDADSLFQLGTFAVPLHELLRQGSGIKKFQAEVDVVQPLDSRRSGDDSDGDDRSAADVESGVVIGKVQYLLSNYGLKGRHVLSNAAIASVPPGSTVQPAGASAAGAERPSQARMKHRVRARPLVESNPELFRLLSREGFYGTSNHRRDRSAGAAEARASEHRKQQARGWSDATSLSPAEIAVLCELFGQQRGTDAGLPALQRSTRIRCDRDGESGLLALLAVNPQLPKHEVAAVEAPRKMPSVASATAPSVVQQSPPPSTQQHADRLKRVLAIVQANQVGLEAAFALFDSDKDGFLSREEFKQALRSMGTVFADLSDDDLAAIASAMDTNSDGRIEYSEFGAFVASSSMAPAQPQRRKSAEQWRDEVKRILVRAMEKGIPVHKIFAEFDASGDGNLSYEEFGRALQRLGVPEADERKHRDALMLAFDANQDNQVSYVEFLQTLGVSVEANKAEVVSNTVQDMSLVLVETLKRVAAEGVEIAHVFTHFDADKDGKLSVAELTQALQQLLQPSSSASPGTNAIQALERASIDAFVAKFNTNGDGEIDYREFLALCGVSTSEQHALAQAHDSASRVQAEKKLIKLLARALQCGMTVETIFEQFDANADGKLTVAELQRSLEELFRGSSVDAAATIAARLDADGDREVSFQEFQSFAREIERNQRALAAIFAPHAVQLAEVEKQTSTLALGKWQQLCAKDLKLTRQQVEAAKPLLAYFELVNAAKKVDLSQLCSLVKEQAGAPAPLEVTKVEPIARLTSLLLKAKAAGLDASAMFAEFDADGDGQVSLREFTAMLQKLGCFEDVSEGEREAMLAAIDRDGSGKLSLRELRALIGEEDSVAPVDALLKRFSTLLEEAIKHGFDTAKCFEHFDKDGGGSITRNEFVEGMKQLGLGADDDSLHEIFQRLDQDGSGAISMIEFKQLFAASATVKNEPLSSTAPADTSDSTTGTASSRQTGKRPPQRAPSFAAARTAKAAAARSELAAPQAVTGSTASPVPAEAAPAISDDKEQQTPSEAPPPSSSDSEHPKPAPSTTEQLRSLLQLAEQSGVDVSVSFSHFDSDGDGKITTAEFVEGVKALPGFEAVAPDELRELVAELDSDASGSVSLGELKAFVKGARTDSINSSSSRRESSTDEKVVEAPVGDASAPPTNEVAQEAAEQTLPTSTLQGTKLASRASSFAASKGKPPSLAAARKAKTDSDSVAGAVDAATARSDSAAGDSVAGSQPGDAPSHQAGKRPPQRAPSFAAARAAKVAAARRGSASHGVAESSGSAPLAEAAPATSNDPGAQVSSDSASPLGQVDPTPASGEKPKSTPEAAAPTTAEISTAAPATARVTSTLAQAPVRRTSSLKPPAKNAATAATDRKLQAPITRTSSLRPAAKAPMVQSEGDAVVTAAPKLPTTKVALEPSPALSAPPPTAHEAATGLCVAPSAPAPPDLVTNCAYSFHEDPQIRAIELKLRRAAVAAYSRGIIPQRVIAKFLEQDDESSSTTARSARKKRDALLRVEFLQVLMELGFSLLSDKDAGDAVDDGSGDLVVGDRPRPTATTRMNDYVYARQLERLARYKHHVNVETAAQKQLVRAVTKTKRQQQQARLGKTNQQVAAAEASLRRFADEKHQLLRVLSYYRDGQKKSLVYSLLRDQVTTTITLAPRFAALLFLELPFENPYNHHERFRVEVVLPQGAMDAVLLDVDVVRSDAEWAFYRLNLPLAYGASGGDNQQPVEKEMIDDHNEVVMDGHDRLQIPVRLRWLGANSRGAPQRQSEEDPPAAVVPVSVVVRSCTHGHTVALFKLQLRPQPLVCHRVLRFSHPSGSIWRWKLRCPRGKFVVCMDPSVAVDGAGDADQAVVAFKCRVGEYPALEQFYVVLYDDKYYATVFEVWQVRIQAKLRLDIHAVLGQSVKNELVIRAPAAAVGSSKRRHVRCFTTFEHVHELQFRPAQVFQLVPNAFNRIEFTFCTTELQPSARVLVNLVDVDTQELVGAWLVHVAISLPLITKTYALHLPVGQPAQKKISYANPWDQQQTITLRSSAPAQLKPRDPVLQVPGNGTAFLRLGFAAVERKTCEDMYLFINDRQTDQNEECLLFQVTYE